MTGHVLVDWPCALTSHGLPGEWADINEYFPPQKVFEHPDERPKPIEFVLVVYIQIESYKMNVAYIW